MADSYVIQTDHVEPYGTFNLNDPNIVTRLRKENIKLLIKYQNALFSQQIMLIVFGIDLATFIMLQNAIHDITNAAIVFIVVSGLIIILGCVALCHIIRKRMIQHTQNMTLYNSL